MTLPAPIDIENGGSIARLADRLNSLIEEADALAEAGHLDLLAYGLADLRKVRRAMSDLESHVEGLCDGLMDRDRVNLDDDVVVERRFGKDRRNWQSEELFRHLFGDQLVDARTGENVTDDIVAVLPLTGSLQWRTRALKDRGVDPDEWAATKPGRTSVNVYRNEQGESDERDHS